MFRVTSYIRLSGQNCTLHRHAIATSILASRQTSIIHSSRSFTDTFVGKSLPANSRRTLFTPRIINYFRNNRRSHVVFMLETRRCKFRRFLANSIGDIHRCSRNPTTRDCRAGDGYDSIAIRLS